MTPQEIFNKVWNHFITEKRPLSFRTGMFGDRVCRYRDGHGNRCAIGVLIPDEQYTYVIEGLTVKGLLRKDCCPTALHDLNKHLILLVDLQNAHDYCTTVEEHYAAIRNRLVSVANKHGLEVPS